jgi:carboxylesterase type B
VTTNYRVNIFANPNARGLNSTTNLGFRDIRQAVEWVYENIGNFGGDPEQITLWGQSAGARSTDQYLFAFPDDPIIRASISSSGNALPGTPPTDPTGSNFTFVAKALGCDFEDPKFELQCMRRIPMQRIENFVGQYQDNSTMVNKSQPVLAFARQGMSPFSSP